MGVLRRVLSIGAGIAAGAVAYKLLKDHNENRQLEGDYIELPIEPEEEPVKETPVQPEAHAEVQPEEPKQTEEPKHTGWEQRPDNGPIANPVTLGGGSEKPIMENGKLDPTRIASPEDFGDWDDMGCQR